MSTAITACYGEFRKNLSLPFLAPEDASDRLSRRNRRRLHASRMSGARCQH
jgi:hypothetical protein